MEEDHGRLEIRQCWSVSDPEYLAQIRDEGHWQGMQTLVLIVSERRIGEQVEFQERYFISSCRKILSASCRLNAIIGASRLVCIGS